MGDDLISRLRSGRIHGNQTRQGMCEEAADALTAISAGVSDWRRREIQMLGAAISKRSWHELETAYDQLRDKMDRALEDNAALAKPQP